MSACRVCNKPLGVAGSHGGNPPDFCSASCKKEAKVSQWRSGKTKTCLSCGNAFLATTSGQKYCAPGCAASGKGARRVVGVDGLSTGVVGAAAELLVSARLLREGWDVFRAVSPSAPCDLIVTKGSAVCRVEVRSSSFLYRSGKLSYSWYAKKDEGRSDVLVMVSGDSMFFAPSLEGWLRGERLSKAWLAAHPIFVDGSPEPSEQRGAG
jgi:hypothetical protein